MDLTGALDVEVKGKYVSIASSLGLLVRAEYFTHAGRWRMWGRKAR